MPPGPRPPHSARARYHNSEFTTPAVVVARPSVSAQGQRPQSSGTAVPLPPLLQDVGLDEADMFNASATSSFFEPGQSAYGGLFSRA